MAAAVQRYAERGYTWLKYHLSPFHNCIEQTRAMQEVAPPGFQIHYDFTHQGNLGPQSRGITDHMPELLERLAEFPVAGCFEDVVWAQDYRSWQELRSRAKRPLVMHGAPSGPPFHEVMHQPADAYMLGHSKIGDAVRRAGLMAGAGVPFMLQNTGGAITRAMVLHMMCTCARLSAASLTLLARRLSHASLPAVPTATFHACTSGEVLKDDVVAERLEPVNGLVKVPDGPGLGLTLDRSELDRLSRNTPVVFRPFIIRTRFANGARMLVRCAEPVGL